MPKVLCEAESIWRSLGRKWPHGGCVRRFIAMICFAHGFARLDPFDWFAGTTVQFGGDIAFGIALITCGLALFITSARRLRVSGRLAALCTAAVYAVLGVAIYAASAGSAFVDALIVVTMLNEATAYE